MFLHVVARDLQSEIAQTDVFVTETAYSPKRPAQNNSDPYNLFQK